jgi:hypothetical protein
MEPKEGQLIQNAKGQFVKGVSGNPKGRPKGSKNQVTLYKLMAEEAFRLRNQEAIDAVLDLILQSALDGDKAARKLVWDSCVSKANVPEDKSAGGAQKITVHRMEVTQTKESDIDNTTKEADNG